MILSFRAMTADAPNCGAVDYIVNLNAAGTSGPLQLHNDRANFSNTSTLAQAPCTSPVLNVAAPLAAGHRDAVGN